MDGSRDTIPSRVSQGRERSGFTLDSAGVVWVISSGPGGAPVCALGADDFASFRWGDLEAKGRRRSALIRHFPFPPDEDPLQAIPDCAGMRVDFGQALHRVFRQDKEFAAWLAARDGQKSGDAERMADQRSPGRDDRQ